MAFHDIPMFLGKSECVSHPPGAAQDAFEKADSSAHRALAPADRCAGLRNGSTRSAEAEVRTRVPATRQIQAALSRTCPLPSVSRS